MDRVSSMETIAADHFWTPPPPHQFNVNNTAALSSSSEWDFQLLIQENVIASVSDHSLSSATRKVDADDEEVVEIGESRAAQPLFGSDEYQAFLKSRLDLACAAVAITRASIGRPQDSSTSTDSGSKVAVHEHSEVNRKGSGSYSCKRKLMDMPPGDLSKPAKGSKLVVQLKSSTSSSSKEMSDDYEFEGGEGIMDHTDDKRMRRMMSNRESARRSRSRKQAHLTDLETQVAQLRVENSLLSNRLADISQKFNEAVVDNRVLKADIETLKTKLEMAEKAAKRVTGQIQVFQTTSETSTFNMLSYDNTDASVPMQDEFGHGSYPQHTLNSLATETSIDSRSSNSLLTNITTVNPHQIPCAEPISSSVTNMETMPPMQRVASLEHLQKRIRCNSSVTQ